MTMAIGRRCVFGSAMLVMRASELIAKHALGGRCNGLRTKFLISRPF